MNTAKTQVIKLDDILGKARTRIHRVGVELEGGWARLPRDTNLEHDGSVQFPELLDPMTGTYGPNYPRAGVGELPSPPLELGDVEKWMTQFYPTHVNGTCGLHVHMSFKNAITYARLMDPRLTSTTLHYVRRWAEQVNLPPDHPLWRRLGGQSPYCQHAYYADLQAQAAQKSHRREGRGNRYTVWNYCFAQHQTVECRLLPMFQDVKQGIEAVHLIIHIVNAYLVRSAAREKPAVGVAAVPHGDAILESITLCV